MTPTARDRRRQNRAIHIFGEIGLKVRVLKVKDAMIRTSLSKKFGAARFRLLLEGAGSAIEFEVGKMRQKYDLDSPDGKVGFLKEFAQFMAGIRNPIERDVYVAKIAMELGVSKEPLWYRFIISSDSRRKMPRKNRRGI